MKGFILDASITLSWCFADEATQKTDDLLNSLEKERAFVPVLWQLEITNILLVAERIDRINYAQAMQFLSLLENANIIIDDEHSARWIHDIVALAHTTRLTTYDSAYLELAIRKGLPLATKDEQLRKVASQLGIKTLPMDTYHE